MSTSFVAEEIRPPRQERTEAIVRGVPRKLPRGTRPKKRTRVLADFFRTMWTGTRARPANEYQRCCICGAFTVLQGESTGHSGAHSKFLGGDR